MLLCGIFIIYIIPLASSNQTNFSLQDVMAKFAGLEERLLKQEKLIKKQDFIIEKQNMQIKFLEKQIANHSAAIRDCRSGQGVVTQRNEVLPENHDHSRNVKKSIDGRIAFTAFMNHDADFGADQTLKFNQIITNEGNGYNMHTGVFTCPEAGMYMFMFFIGERGEKEGITQMYADLKVNSQNVIDAVAETRHIYEDAQGGNSVVIRLKQGDAVWISNRYNGFHIEGDMSRVSSFTGLFLYS
ncbi:complement C1q-like protein 4 [Ruditapes philippinarum]|uniref:complement C1q-like protein 4 n=1 Tax=Ruditapes philippinarum TaxID=129788 RepID=UPI00295A5ADD|nr:complement C1q-like protein 4 [Ruditapes philippinarum]